MKEISGYSGCALQKAMAMDLSINITFTKLCKTVWNEKLENGDVLSANYYFEKHAKKPSRQKLLAKLRFS